MANQITRIAGRNFYPDELQHHGVLGMKWGRHLFGKNQGQSVTTKSSKVKPKKETLDDKIKKMSDEEVQKAANRLSNEVRLKENYAKLHPKEVSRGKRFVNDLGKQLYSAGMDATKQVATDYIKKQMSAAISKATEKDK